MAASGGSGAGYVYSLAVAGRHVYTGTNNAVSLNTALMTGGFILMGYQLAGYFQQ